MRWWINLKIKPAIELPYRWRDWAAQSYGPSAVASERRTDITHLPPEQLAASVLQKEQRIAEIMGNIQRHLTTPK